MRNAGTVCDLSPPAARDRLHCPILWCRRGLAGSCRSGGASVPRHASFSTVSTSPQPSPSQLVSASGVAAHAQTQGAVVFSWREAWQDRPRSGTPGLKAWRCRPSRGAWSGGRAAAHSTMRAMAVRQGFAASYRPPHSARRHLTGPCNAVCCPMPRNETTVTYPIPERLLDGGDARR